MKKAFAFVLLLFLATWAYPADFKIMGGLSLSKSTDINPGGLAIYSWRAQYGAGFAAGGGIEFSLAKSLALEIDALFIQKGTRVRFVESGDPPVYWIERINELSIPVLVKVLLRPGTSPYILGGGEFALVLTDRPKSTDYGLVGGIGFKKQLDKLGMSLEARYHHGLQDLRPNSVIFPAISTLSRKMRVFVFMIGFSI